MLAWTSKRRADLRDLGGVGELDPGRNQHGLDRATGPAPVARVHGRGRGDRGPGHFIEACELLAEQSPRRAVTRLVLLVVTQPAPLRIRCAAQQLPAESGDAGLIFARAGETWLILQGHKARYMLAAFLDTANRATDGGDGQPAEWLAACIMVPKAHADLYL